MNIQYNKISNITKDIFTKVLSKKEKEVIFSYLGINDLKQKSFEDISKIIQMSVDNTKSLYQKTICKIRQIYETNCEDINLKNDDDMESFLTISIIKLKQELLYDLYKKNCKKYLEYSNILNTWYNEILCQKSIVYDSSFYNNISVCKNIIELNNYICIYNVLDTSLNKMLSKDKSFIKNFEHFYRKLAHKCTQIQHKSLEKGEKRILTFHTLNGKKRVNISKLKDEKDFKDLLLKLKNLYIYHENLIKELIKQEQEF